MGPRKKFRNLQAWLGGSSPSFGPDLISKSGQKQKWSKWVQNRRFGLKIGPRESYGHFGPVRTGPGPKNVKKYAEKKTLGNQDLALPETSHATISKANIKRILAALHMIQASIQASISTKAKVRESTDLVCSAVRNYGDTNELHP